MEEPKSLAKDAVLADTKDAIERARLYASKYRYWDIRLLIISIVFGALATCLAAGAAAGGQKALEMTFASWRYLCFAVAALTAVGTVAGTMHKSLHVTDRVADAEKCIARLRALELAVRANLMDLQEAAKAYTQISDDHSRPLA